MDDKKEEVKKMVTLFVEALDNQLPFIGVLMDIPCIDAIEEQAIGLAIDALLADDSRDTGTWLLISA